jgi:hypothetical protein
LSLKNQLGLVAILRTSTHNSDNPPLIIGVSGHTGVNQLGGVFVNGRKFQQEVAQVAGKEF